MSIGQCSDQVVNESSIPLSGAVVQVLTTSMVAATIYSDAGGLIPLANPVTTDGSGNFTFYAATGQYILTISYSGNITSYIPVFLGPGQQYLKTLVSTDMAFLTADPAPIVGGVVLYPFTSGVTPYRLEEMRCIFPNGQVFTLGGTTQVI